MVLHWNIPEIVSSADLQAEVFIDWSALPSVLWAEQPGC